MGSKSSGTKILPLRSFTIHSRPFVKRGIAFSCDGDLAVGGDDCVFVYVPEFPKPSSTLSNRLNPLESVAPGPSVENDESIPLFDEGGDDAPQDMRAQYSAMHRVIPVSKPPLDPRINKRLYKAAGLPFPMHSVYRSDGVGSENEDEDMGPDSEDDAPKDEEEGYVPIPSGSGPITGTHSSLNHLVALAWSPTGLGAQQRPVLATLTALGVLTIFGDGTTPPSVPPLGESDFIPPRSLEAWRVLWGIGERVTVPGQQTAWAENIKGFSWARDVGPGQALLACVNDVREVMILSVQTALTLTEDRKRKGNGEIEIKEKLVWLVREVARFEAKGPHPAPNAKDSFLDPDWTPSGTSFGLSWSPWLVSPDGSRSCLLSYVDANYVGFRRITIDEPWLRGMVPKLTVAEKDSHGRCVHLSTDAFVEFENFVASTGDSNTCRGYIATPMKLESFSVDITGVSVDGMEQHRTQICGTTYSPDDQNIAGGNPIIDLVIHPVNRAQLWYAPVPIYTLIRLSATPGTDNWYESNQDWAAIDPTKPLPKPQWAQTIARKLALAIPAEMDMRHNAGGDGNEEDMADDEGDEHADGESDDEDMFASQENPELGNGDKNDTNGTSNDIHPHRFRLWGLASSPGGGATALLAIQHSTHKIENIIRLLNNSTVFFGYKNRRKDAHEGERADRDLTTTTEGLMFEWMYGMGPDVDGVTTHNGYQSPRAADSTMDTIFADARRNQKCDVCGTAMHLLQDRKTAGMTVCEKRHRFGTCGTTGLAIQHPGTTRTCGVCGARTMRLSELIKRVPEKKEEIMNMVGSGCCRRCLGKFLN